MSPSRHNIRRLSSIRAFTLIEVLVVVAIIALLVSILMPSLAAAKRQARVVVCATNLKTFGTATMFYAQASKDELPAGYLQKIENSVLTGKKELSMNPWEFLAPYVMKVGLKAGGTGSSLNESQFRVEMPPYKCPDDLKFHESSERMINTPTGPDDMPGYPLSYGANLIPMFNDPVKATLAANIRAELFKQPAGKNSSVKSASQIVLYFDNNDDGIGISQFREDTGNDELSGWRTTECQDRKTANPMGVQCSFEVHHKTGNNFSFMDGHVTYHTMGYSGPYYGLPHFPAAWIPGYNPANWGGASWITEWATGTPRRAFHKPKTADE